MGGLEQVPVAGLHVPALWQESSGLQVTGLVPWQVPAWQTSVCVHRLPSLQAVPSGAVGLEHVPVEGLQVPGSWHASVGKQVTGLEPWQDPAWHA
jgi:hypothetical protein